MRVLLQDQRSKRYYQGRELWTPNADEAFDFQYSGALPEFADKLDLLDAQLVIAPERPAPACIALG